MNKNQWWNNYVGIPYAPKGRTVEGLDCWGLVRLVYKNEFDIELPSYSEYYEDGDQVRQAELIHMYKEGWRVADTPKTGDVVLFRILGEDSHVGVITTPGIFLHVRQNQSTCIEKLDNPIWKNRIEGVYKYVSGSTDLVLSACPHPLKTVRIDTTMPPGSTISQMIRLLERDNQIPAGLKTSAVVFVDSEIIPADQWDVYIPAPGTRIEYRIVPEGSVGRLLGIIAIAVFAWYAAPMLVGGSWGGMGALSTAAGTGAFGLSAAATGALAASAINMVGGLLLNAIFPVRPPKIDGNAGKPLYQLQGGANQSSPYGAIPVVLGTMRYTPPQGANAYYEASGTESYLHQFLIWGYGPLLLRDIKIGVTPIIDFKEVEQAYAYGYSTPSGTFPYYTLTEDYNTLNSLFDKDVKQLALNMQPTYNEPIVRVLDEFVDRIVIDFQFPNGLWYQHSDGDTGGASFKATVELDEENGSTWKPAQDLINTKTISIPPGYITTQVTYKKKVTSPAYKWTSIYVDASGVIQSKSGYEVTTPTGTPPSSSTEVYNEWSGTFETTTINYERLPVLDTTDIKIFDICSYGDTIYTTNDFRSSTGVTGCALSFSGLNATIASGEVARALVEIVNLNKKTKKAFAHKVSFNVSNNIKYKIRITKTSNSNENTKIVDTCQILGITGFSNTRDAVTFHEKVKPLCMSTYRIKASDQLTGMMEGITATVSSLCLDWDSVNEIWVTRPTSNPASLFRYLLQHPANSKPRLDSEINLAKLQEWHEYCDSEGWQYNHVLTGQFSILEVLKDICAAGRASPTIVDGKWTVIIDIPRTLISQHFTPRNSWGFEGSRTLNRIPDALRVSFLNEAKGFEIDERIVYNDNFDVNSAQLFEQIELPGITSAASVFKHTRFHLSQLKLRPELYSLNTDIEHIVCTRGDLVRVTHSTPMWGSNTARILRSVDNILSYSEDFTHSVWVKTNASISSNVINSPIESLTADKLVENSATTVVHSIKAASVTTANIHTFSIYLKAGERTYALISFDTVQSVGINLTNGIITETTGSNIYAETIPYADNWWRVVVTATVSAIRDVYIYTSTNGIFANRAYTGNGTSGIYLWGAQLQQASEVNTYLPTSNTPLTELVLDNDFDIQSNTAYCVRIRSDDGSSTVKNLVNYTSSDSTNTIYLSSACTEKQRAFDNLVLFGLVNNESVELIVQSIEPMDNFTAKITFNDYSPSVYDSDTELIPEFNSKITNLPYLLNNLIIETPTIDSIYSDERAMVRLSPGVYTYNIVVSITHTLSSNKLNSYAIEAQYAPIEELDEYAWASIKSDNALINSITIPEVSENSEYKIRLRYISIEGRAGPWTSVQNHIVQGRINPPLEVLGGSYTIVGTNIILTWTPNEEPDVELYEVRLADTNWGADTNYLFRGAASSCILAIDLNADTNTTYYIRAIDSVGNYSSTSETVIFTIPAVTPVLGTSIEYNFNLSTTNTSLVTLYWSAPDTLFGIKAYRITLDGVNQNPELISYTNSITLPTNWKGNRTFNIIAIDIRDKESTASNKVININYPSQVSQPTSEVINTHIILKWAANTPILGDGYLPVIGYEIRLSDSNWGSTGYVYRGSQPEAILESVGGTSQTWYIKAFDTYFGYSSTVQSYTFTPNTVENVTNVSHSFFDTSTTSATITLKWNEPTTPQFGLKHYTISYNGDSISTISTSIILPADWVGLRTYTVYTIDNNNQSSTGEVYQVTKYAPNPPSSFYPQVIDNTVMLSWLPPTATSLPISHYIIKTGDSWGTAEDLGRKDGAFTTISELQAGNYTYWICSVDTDDVESTPISITCEVNEPPGFVFHGHQFAQYGTTDPGLVSFTNSKYYDYEGVDSVVLPINISETYSQHFTTYKVSASAVVSGGTGYAVNDIVELSGGTYTIKARAKVASVSGSAVTGLQIIQPGSYTVSISGTQSTTSITGSGTGLTITATSGTWSTPQNQIDAGYPVFITPSVISGSYTETFDFAQGLSSSKIIVSCDLFNPNNLLVRPKIEVSPDNSSWVTYDGVWDAFASNFRYVKVTISVETSLLTTNIVRISNLNCLLNAKAIEDSGSVTAISSDSNGTIVNFSKEFIDVTSIIVSPAGTTALIPVYDYKDTLITGTYNLVSNICTITATNHAQIAGQAVYLYFSSGTAPSGVYNVASVINANSFTVSIISGNTSGSLSVYSQGFRVYLFNNSGTRQSGDVSWNVKGY